MSVTRLLLFLLVACLGPSLTWAATDAPKLPSGNEAEFEKPLYKPFIERYILDEIKALREDNLKLRAELTEKVAEARLNASDRAIRYTADTTNNIFYIITAAASMLVLLGWRSLRDMKDNIESVTSIKLSELTKEYEDRLGELEKKLRQRSEQILKNQEEISVTNHIHSLWMRAALEKSDQEKVAIYDHILELHPDDVEAMTYKADALLELGETKWALSLANQAIEKDEAYSLAYWQRACARSVLGQLDDAVDDLEVAIKLSEVLSCDLKNEGLLENLNGFERFDALVESLRASSETICGSRSAKAE